jgi:hypothetical protein
MANTSPLERGWTATALFYQPSRHGPVVTSFEQPYMTPFGPPATASLPPQIIGSMNKSPLY